MDYIKIIELVLIVALGGISYYLRTYTKVFDKVAVLIAEAEEMYQTYSGAGAVKMEWCIQQLNKIIPKALKPILTDAVLQTLIQSVFDAISDYVDVLKDKAADKINETVDKIDIQK